MLERIDGEDADYDDIDRTVRRDDRPHPGNSPHLQTPVRRDQRVRTEA